MIGLGVGLAACIAPLYIQELSPTRLRGRMVTLNVVMITGGQVVAYAIGAAFERIPRGWRWMVGLGSVPAALQLLCLVFLPESRKTNVSHLAYRCTKIIFSPYPHTEGSKGGSETRHEKDLQVCNTGTSRCQSACPVIVLILNRCLMVVVGNKFADGSPREYSHC